MGKPEPSLRADCSERRRINVRVGYATEEQGKGRKGERKGKGRKREGNGKGRKGKGKVWEMVREGKGKER